MDPMKRTHPVIAEILVAVVAGYLVLVAATALFQRSMIYHPGRTRPDPASVGLPEMVPLPGEAVVVKHGLSGLISTGLKTLLREAGHDRLVVPGGEANMCVESTVRMAGNLGFKTTVVADALINFGRRARDGREISPQDVLDMTLSNLRSFARIVESGEVSAA